MCLIHQNPDEIKPHLIEICDNSICKECNAFVPRYTRDEIKEIFKTELSDQKIKEKKYPEICALEWVLEKNLSEFIIPSWIKRLFSLIFLYFRNFNFKMCFRKSFRVKVS